MASGEKSKARDIIAAIRTLRTVEQENRPATDAEKLTLGRFSGFGPVALSIFPNPITGQFKDAGWQSLGEELQSLLTPAEYDSAKRTTFNAFYTSPTVIQAIHQGIKQLGVSANATILEPGCGTGNFIRYAAPGSHFIGIEMDSISGRLAKALHPGQDIRIENFRDTRLPEGRIDAVVGNVPFADIKLDYEGMRLSLHDYFFAKSIDALKPGGVMALVTSHYTLDKQNAAIREYLADKADFVGAIRLPSDAFKREGTAVVTDIVFFRKRDRGGPAHHVDPDWLGVAPLAIDGAEVSINRYFVNHPEMVLGTWSRKDTLYGGDDGYSVISNGDLLSKLNEAIGRLPRFDTGQAAAPLQEDQATLFPSPPPQRYIAEGSFFVGDNRIIHQLQDGRGVPVVYGGTILKADGTLVGKRLAALVGLRDRARRVLQSQNEEREIHELLKAYTESRSEAVAGTKADYGTDFIHKLLKKRLFSSPMAFATTLAKHRQSLANRGEHREPTGMRERILHKAILRSEEEYADDEQIEEAQDEAVEAATELATPLTDEQGQMLDKMAAWADRAKNKSDSKAKAILAWLDEHLLSDGEPNKRRVILFTEYRATHSWLMQILATSGWGGEKLMVLHGGTDPEERERIKAAFQSNPDDSAVRILLATDAASEGIDLQNHCNYLIHIEIPWNPNVMEQRNGRIDRHGQKQKQVCIWHPVGAGAVDASVDTKPGDIVGDHEFLMRAVKKVDSIRQDLGCVGAVITQQIEEAMLGRRVEMDTRDAEDRAANARKFVAAEKRLQERIARLHERLLEARNSYQLTPERVARAVDVALQLAGKPALEPIKYAGQVGKIAYKVPLLTGSWDQATYGLPHPHTGTRRPITFDHSLAQGRDDVVLAHLQHKLVQMSLRLLRAEIWAQQDRKKLQRVAVRTVSRGEIDDPIAIIWSRLVITGGGHHRLHEELTIAGGDLKSGAFSRIRTLGRLEELLEKSTPAQPTMATFSELQRRFASQKSSIMKAVEARSRERREFLTNAIERRRDQEVADLNQVLDDLTTMIERELKDSNKFVQIELWPSDQREALRRDMESLRSRLVRIPEEREREVENLRRRYAKPIDRTFPVAVEFIVPAGFEGGR